MTETFQLVLSSGAGGLVNIPAAGSIATITIAENDGELSSMYAVKSHHTN